MQVIRVLTRVIDLLHTAAAEHTCVASLVCSNRIGNTYLTCSFTVIEHSEMDLLVGLDVLRKYECEISLGKNIMTFSAAGVQQEVAFLSRIEMDKDSPQQQAPKTRSSDS